MIRLELERRKRNLTQNELGKLVKMTSSDICRYEKCIMKPYPRHLLRLSEFFNIPQEELVKEV